MGPKILSVKNAERRSSDYADVACASAWRLLASGGGPKSIPGPSLDDLPSNHGPRPNGDSDPWAFSVYVTRTRRCHAPRTRGQTPWRVRRHPRDCMTRVRITAAILSTRWKARSRRDRGGWPRHGVGLFSWLSCPSLFLARSSMENRGSWYRAIDSDDKSMFISQRANIQWIPYFLSLQMEYESRFLDN